MRKMCFTKISERQSHLSKTASMIFRRHVPLQRHNIFTSLASFMLPKTPKSMALAMFHSTSPINLAKLANLCAYIAYISPFVWSSLVFPCNPTLLVPLPLIT